MSSSDGRTPFPVVETTAMGLGRVKTPARDHSVELRFSLGNRSATLREARVTAASGWEPQKTR